MLLRVFVLLYFGDLIANLYFLLGSERLVQVPQKILDDFADVLCFVRITGFGCVFYVLFAKSLAEVEHLFVQIFVVGRVSFFSVGLDHFSELESNLV